MGSSPPRSLRPGTLIQSASGLRPRPHASAERLESGASSRVRAPGGVPRGLFARPVL